MQVGFVGTGNMGCPMARNIVALSNQAALCEAMALADRLGIPRQTVGEVAGKSSGASFILERKLKAIVDRDSKAGFFVDLAWKDLGLGLELAAAAGAQAAVGREAWKLYGQAREAGLGKLDTSALLGLLEPKP